MVLLFVFGDLMKFPIKTVGDEMQKSGYTLDKRDTYEHTRGSARKKVNEEMWKHK